MQFLVALTVTLPAVAENLPTSSSTDWTITLSAALKETFDSNVYLQDQTSRAQRESLVTTLQSQLIAKWNGSSWLNAALCYQPEANWFHAETSENFVLQRAVLNLSGRGDDISYESATSLVLINGDSASLIWTGPGGAPATGAATVRDRRDATVYRSSFRVTREFGDWFARPVATFYLHDFQTDQRAIPGYQSFVDRGEVTVGADLGRRFGAWSAWSGYRYGVQNQARLLQFPEEYDSTFHRILFGAEGSLATWLKFNVTLGPEFRRYGDKVHPTFGARDEFNIYVDASCILTPTAKDTLGFLAKRFEQPGASGRAAYEDSTYEITWRHKFNAAWTAGLSGRAYGTAFLKPAQRDDWILSQSAFLNWTINQNWNAELSYAHESGETTTPGASGREYERHLVALGLRYNFGGWP